MKSDMQKLTNNKPFRNWNVLEEPLKLDITRLVSWIQHLPHRTYHDGQWLMEQLQEVTMNTSLALVLTTENITKKTKNVNRPKISNQTSKYKM